MHFRDNQPIQGQLADYVCEKILLKQWLAGERIPSIRDLGFELQVNPNTVVRAYEFLQQKKIIFNKRGIGYFVGENAPDHILAYRREQFIEAELPVFFRTLYLLNIDIKEIEKRYQAYVKAEFNLQHNP